MNKLKNKVSLIGRIGMQPEVKAFDSGKTLIRFSLATNESYKDNLANDFELPVEYEPGQEEVLDKLFFDSQI